MPPRWLQSCFLLVNSAIACHCLKIASVNQAPYKVLTVAQPLIPAKHLFNSKFQWLALLQSGRRKSLNHLLLLYSTKSCTHVLYYAQWHTVWGTNVDSLVWIVLPELTWWLICLFLALFSSLPSHFKTISKCSRELSVKLICVDAETCQDSFG